MPYAKKKTCSKRLPHVQHNNFASFKHVQHDYFASFTHVQHDCFASFMHVQHDYFATFKHVKHSYLLTMSLMTSFRLLQPSRTKNRELTQPRRRRQQERHKFAYLTMKNNSFARFTRAVFIFDISHTFSFFLRREMTCFAVVWTTWGYDDKCSILSSYLWSAGSNLIPG